MRLSRGSRTPPRERPSIRPVSPRHSRPVIEELSVAVSLSPGRLEFVQTFDPLVMPAAAPAPISA